MPGASRRARVDQQGRLWAVAGAIGLVALLVYVLRNIGAERIDAPLSISIFALAGIFYVVEIDVIKFDFRKSSHSFSLNEVPLVLGLIFTPPAFIVPAQIVGTGLALAIHRRQSPLKISFNLSQFALGSALGVVVHRAILAGETPVALRGWFAALAGAAVASIVSVTATSLAINLAEGAGRATETRGEVAFFGALNALGNTMIALATAVLLWHEPTAVVLLVGPTLMLYAAYRAYSAQRRKHQSLEFLYQSSRLLTQSPQIEQALLSLLREARETFRAEAAEVILFAIDDDRGTLRTSVRGDDELEVLVPVLESEVDDALRDLVADGRTVVVHDAKTAGTLVAPYVHDRHYRDAMIAPLQGETRTIGAFVMANRISSAGRFSREDVRLFETLSNQASVSLEYGRLEKTLAQLTELKERLRHQALHDSLTQLANRRMFVEQVDAALESCPEDRNVAVLFIDLDDFKTVNDSLGHEAGDKLLIAVAHRLRSCLRPSDTAARFGGDEFAVLLPESEGAVTAVHLAERIIQAMQKPLRLAGNQMTVRGSVGIAVSMGDTPTSAELLRNADVAMYEAKTHEKGRFAVFEAGMHEAAIQRLRLRAELERAVDEQQFVLHYQPIVNLSSAAVVGVEALVRWNHPERGIVGPFHFIELAEETGLIVEIGRQVLLQACREVVRWDERFPDHPPMLLTVNLSGRQVVAPRIIEDVREALHETGLEAGRLVLEITESVVMQDTDLSLKRLDELTSLGLSLAIDDFGTGYSSLAYLRRFPVAILKVAKPFVDGIEEGTDDALLARGIIELAHSLGLRTIAEGIEYETQHHQLHRWSCDLGQGYHFAKPLPSEALIALLEAGPGTPVVPPPPPLPRPGQDLADDQSS